MNAGPESCLIVLRLPEGAANNLKSQRHSICTLRGHCKLTLIVPRLPEEAKTSAPTELGEAVEGLHAAVADGTGTPPSPPQAHPPPLHMWLAHHMGLG